MKASIQRLRYQRFPYKKTDDHAPPSGIIGQLLVLGIALRIWCSQLLWNDVVPYSTPGGNILLKINPGSYLIFLVFAVVCFSPGRLDRRAGWIGLSSLIMLLACVGCMIIAVSQSNTSSLGYAIDTLAVSAAASYSARVLTYKQAIQVVRIICYWSIANAVVTIIEFGVHRDIVPSKINLGDAFYRPTGLSGHPLFTGLWCIISFPILDAVVKSKPLLIACKVTLVLATICAGARLATIVIFSIAMIQYMFVGIGEGSSRKGSKARRQPVLLRLGIAIAALVAMVGVGTQLHLFERFERRGLYDDSAASRVDIYQIFKLLDPKQVLLGMDLDQAEDLARRQSHVLMIESPVVLYTVQFGAVGCGILAIGLGCVLASLLPSLRQTTGLALMGFLIACTGTIVLATKEAELPALLTLLVSFRNPRSGPAQQSRGRSNFKLKVDPR